MVNRLQGFLLQSLSLGFLFLIGTGLAFLLRFLLSPDNVQKDSGEPKQFGNAANHVPFLMWTEKNNTVIWGNHAYNSRFNKASIEGISAFDISQQHLTNKHLERGRLHRPNQASPHEYTITRHKEQETEYYCAVDATPLLEAEQELQRFIQTLTDTFAHLPLGLAIFDKKRDLSLFNPALSELLQISPEWLARRPSLRGFLDQLRNDGTMPEPADFKSLRQEFIDLESGAEKGTFNEEWTLPTGRIYRIVGRPHLKGGLALIFEDVSKAVIVERHYRTELEQLYAAFDCLGCGIAIFDHAGELVFVNDAFDDIWNSDLANVAKPMTAINVSIILQNKCLPSPSWGDFREYVLDGTERAQWDACVTLHCGKEIQMIFSPIAGGQILCEFNLIENSALPLVAALKNSA